MEEGTRFLISASMTSKFHKGYRTYAVVMVCNEFTMKGNVRRYGRFLSCEQNLRLGCRSNTTTDEMLLPVILS